MAAKRGVVLIKDSEGVLITDKNLYLESDISLGISSSYQPLVSGGGSAVVKALISGTSIGSAGFKQQGFQVWEKTNPLSLKLSVSLRMITSGRLDVIEPAKELMKYAVPDVADNQWGLIPPGPNLLTILGDAGADLGDRYDVLRQAGGWVSISVGSYLNLNKCIMKNVIPTYSLQEDTNGFPVSCKLDIDLETVDIATSEMIENLSNLGI